MIQPNSSCTWLEPTSEETQHFVEKEYRTAIRTDNEERNSNEATERECSTMLSK